MSAYTQDIGTRYDFQMHRIQFLHHTALHSKAEARMKTTLMNMINLFLIRRMKQNDCNEMEQTQDVRNASEYNTKL